MNVKKTACLSVASAKGVKKKANFFAFFSRRAKPLCVASVRQFLAKERLQRKQSVATDREAATRAFWFRFLRRKKEREKSIKLKHSKQKKHTKYENKLD